MTDGSDKTFDCAVGAEKDAGGAFKAVAHVAAVANTHSLRGRRTAEGTGIEAEAIARSYRLAIDNNDVVQGRTTIDGRIGTVLEVDGGGGSSRAISALNLQSGDNTVASGDRHGAGAIGVNDDTHHAIT